VSCSASHATQSRSTFGSIANDGTTFYFLTNKNAPRYKLVSINIAEPVGQRVFKDVIPQDKDAHLEDILPINNDKFVVVYKRNVKDEIYIYGMDGQQLERVASDFVGAASIAGRRTQKWFFATLTGFTNPGIVAHYDFSQTEESKKWSIYRTTLLKGLKAENFEAQQVRPRSIYKRT
jgi:prolyl oligopeptidase